MSIHKSFKAGKNNVLASKSVLTRYERIQILSKRGKLNTEKDKATGLPKTRQ